MHRCHKRHFAPNRYINRCQRYSTQCHPPHCCVLTSQPKTRFPPRPRHWTELSATNLALDTCALSEFERDGGNQRKSWCIINTFFIIVENAMSGDHTKSLPFLAIEPIACQLYLFAGYEIPDRRGIVDWLGIEPKGATRNVE